MVVRMPGSLGWRATAMLAVLALVALAALAFRPGPGAVPAASAPADPAAACQDLRAGAMVACLHGNDVPPPGVSLFERPTLQELEARSSLGSPSPRLRGVASLEQATEEAAAGGSAALPCIGDGTSGKRIQAIYARAADQPDAYSTVLASLRQWAVEMDHAVWVSAGQTGGGRRLRFVTNQACELAVDRVVLSAQGDDSFSQMSSELRALGYTRSERK